MTAQVFLVGFALVKIIYQGLLDALSDVQRKRPLPEEVGDVYDADRYNDYLSIVSDERKAYQLYRLVDVAILVIVLISGFFAAVDDFACGNVYLIAFLSFLLFRGVSAIEKTILLYHVTFRIDEKYGLNRQDKKGFAKDTLYEEISTSILGLVIVFIVVFLGESLPEWTNGFTVGLVPAFWAAVSIALCISTFAIFASAVSVFVMIKKYSFSPLPEGELRSDIEKLIEGPKKVREIYVYDESSKSTGKNAFVVRILWLRFIGIADNCLESDSRRELLATLSHEVGHLRQKRNAWDFALYGTICLLFVAVVLFIIHPEPILLLVDWTQQSFGLTAMNYFLVFAVFSELVTPIVWGVGVLRNCGSRSHEYDADREAVRNGYGPELETSLKRYVRDDLMCVNPHPVIEILEYDHPGLANRIRAIREAGVGYSQGL